MPTGNNWDYEPFGAEVKGPFMIGRGAGDNKGPAIGILYMMQCLRELEIPLKHELCLFVGTDEERGMADLEHYVAHYPSPKMSMIADSGFPVCYGEKGIIEGQLVAKTAVSSQIIELGGGSVSNMIPDKAQALLENSKDLLEEIEALLEADTPDDAENRLSDWITCQAEPAGIRIVARGTAKHSAFPYGSVNAIHKLSTFLTKLTALSENDRKLFGELAELTAEYNGEYVGIAYEDEVSGKTTCAGTVLALEEGHPVLTLNIRYAITAEDEENIKSLASFGAAHGFEWQLERNSRPSYFPKEHPAVDLLTNLFNEITGRDTKSFVMGGGTYARKLPNAFAYGIGGMQESDEDKAVRQSLLRPGHGGAHEPDEVLNLNLWLEAMKIYTMAIVELNEIEL